VKKQEGEGYSQKMKKEENRKPLSIRFEGIMRFLTNSLMIEGGGSRPYLRGNADLETLRRNKKGFGGGIAAQKRAEERQSGTYLLGRKENDVKWDLANKGEALTWSIFNLKGTCTSLSTASKKRKEKGVTKRRINPGMLGRVPCDQGRKLRHDLPNERDPSKEVEFLGVAEGIIRRIGRAVRDQGGEAKRTVHLRKKGEQPELR